MTDECYAVAKKMILENKEKIQLLSNELIEKNTIDFPDIKRILGPSSHDLKSVQGFMDLKKDIENKKVAQ